MRPLLSFLVYNKIYPPQTQKTANKIREQKYRHKPAKIQSTAERVRNMKRKITIKGTGKMTVKPDFVIVSITVEAKEKKYASAVESAAKKISRLNEALEHAGLTADSAKTVSYDVRPNYNFVRDRKNQMQRQLDGYLCVHRLKIEFDYNAELLEKVLATISGSLADPQLDVSFTVKDKDAVEAKLLGNAAEDARRKAEILCTGCGAALGKLIRIDYDWHDINVYARADLRMEDTCGFAMSAAEVPPVPIQPKDIDVSDFAVFVWEIQ